MIYERKGKSSESYEYNNHKAKAHAIICHFQVDIFMICIKRSLEVGGLQRYPRTANYFLFKAHSHWFVVIPYTTFLRGLQASLHELFVNLYCLNLWSYFLLEASAVHFLSGKRLLSSDLTSLSHKTLFINTAVSCFLEKILLTGYTLLSAIFFYYLIV